jgi:hypothetical protein
MPKKFSAPKVNAAGSKKKSSQLSKAKSELNPLAPGMPALNNVKEVVDFVSPQGVERTILKTDERDAYDRAPAKKRRWRKRR